MAGSVQYTVILDACVLYPFCVRDILIRLAHAETYRARWTASIQEEWRRNLLAKKPEITLDRITYTQELMAVAVEDAEITNYEYLIPTLNLPDEDDNHVLAAGIVGHVDAIVTMNLKDFPSEIISKHEIEVIHPDEFLCNQLDLYKLPVLAQVKAARAALKNPPKSPEDLIESYIRSGLFQFAEELKDAMELI